MNTAVAILTTSGQHKMWILDYVSKTVIINFNLGSKVFVEGGLPLAVSGVTELWQFARTATSL